MSEHYVVERQPRSTTVWIVWTSDTHQDITYFDGHGAEARAQEYADWKNESRLRKTITPSSLSENVEELAKRQDLSDANWKSVLERLDVLEKADNNLEKYLSQQSDQVGMSIASLTNVINKFKERLETLETAEKAPYCPVSKNDNDRLTALEAKADGLDEKLAGYIMSHEAQYKALARNIDELSDRADVWRQAHNTLEQRVKALEELKSPGRITQTSATISCPVCQRSNVVDVHGAGKSGFKCRWCGHGWTEIVPSTEVPHPAPKRCDPAPKSHWSFFVSPEAIELRRNNVPVIKIAPGAGETLAAKRMILYDVVAKLNWLDEEPF